MGVGIALDQPAARQHFHAQIVAALGPLTEVTLSAVRVYLAQFREDAGAPTDPIVKILTDQVASMHLLIGSTHGKAANTINMDQRMTYQNYALRLQSSMCNLISTLSQYRNSLQPQRRAGARGADDKPTPSARGREGQQEKPDTPPSEDREKGAHASVP